MSGLGLARFERVEGTVSRVDPSRTFIDGVYCDRVEFTAGDGTRRTLPRVFFTNKLVPLLDLHTSGTFYFWNSHCYAFRDPHRLVEDIEGARASYFQRDARLLMIMAASIVFLPVVAFVAMRKLLRAASADRMQTFLSTP